MKTFRPPCTSRERAFTLVEIMISTGLISVIMLLLVGTIDQTQRVWKRTTEKTSQFQAARGAFESMNRRLSQATLNTYWRAHEVDTNLQTSDFLFRRQSELQFISGPTRRFFGSTPQLINLSTPVDKAYPGHAMFFQAPIGFTEEPDSDKYQAPKFRNLDSLLTACGYFVEYGPETDRPEFLAKMSPPPSLKYRFRLMEMTVPTEHLQVYYRPQNKDDIGYADPRIFDRSNNYYVGMTDSKRKSNPNWNRPLWMEEAFLREKVTGVPIDRFRYAHVRADNIVGMIILPKLAEKDRVIPGTKSHDSKQLALAPEYEFDSWRILSGGTVNSYDLKIKLDNTARDNLLPPIVQVTMIAVDEASMVRANASESNIPSWLDGLFLNVKTVDDYMDDVRKLEKKLLDDPNKPNYRIFSTDVLLRASKWSRDPQDKAN
ncbi:MAG: Verru Chthon cassette protein [Chthoniobacteraceae bacterium]|nr:Verru Chthon cassette protein [Chthoniobacteraceae bacterium]